MGLELKHQRSNFSQFSDSLWLLATNGESTIRFDVDQPEMLEFALHLIGVADDCLRAANDDTDDAEEKLAEAVEAIRPIPKSNRRDLQPQRSGTRCRGSTLRAISRFPAERSSAGTEARTLRL